MGDRRCVAKLKEKGYIKQILTKIKKIKVKKPEHIIIIIIIIIIVIIIIAIKKKSFLISTCCGYDNKKLNKKAFRKVYGDFTPIQEIIAFSFKKKKKTKSQSRIG